MRNQAGSDNTGVVAANGPGVEALKVSTQSHNVYDDRLLRRYVNFEYEASVYSSPAKRRKA